MLRLIRDDLDGLDERARRHARYFSIAELYNAERPHQARGNVPLPDADEEGPRILPFPSGEVRCRERLGGLLRHYHRAA